jgi:hypothetical protein
MRYWIVIACLALLVSCHGKPTSEQVIDISESSFYVGYQRGSRDMLEWTLAVKESHAYGTPLPEKVDFEVQINEATEQWLREIR